MKSNIKIIKHRDFDFEKVRFYTVKFEEEKQNQLDHFFETYEKEFPDSINDLLQWIANIGEKFGAKENFFRPEDNVKALPPSPKSYLFKRVDFETKDKKSKLRLYCIVLSEEVVILVNGGEKISRLTQDSPSCWKQYLFTSSLGAQIEQQIELGNMSLNGKMIKRTKRFKLEYKKDN